MSKHCVLFLPILATALALAQDDSGNWVEVRSEHFTVFTDGSEKQACRIATQFESMRELFQDLYPQLHFDPESPVVVLAAKSQVLFRALQPGAYLSKENLKLRGWFLSNSGKRYILMRTDLRGGDPFPVAFHEYTHLVLDEMTDSLPLWLDEGLAEFYANTKIQYEKVLLGEPNQHYLKLLRSEKPFPLTTLFAIEETSPYYMEKNRGSIFYAESWALARYLTLKDYEEKTSRVAQYMELVGEKMDPVTAAASAFGDLKKLDKAFGFYIQQQTLNHIETTIATKVDASEFEVLSITSIQAEALKADFLACSGRLEDARVLASRVLQQDPDNSSAQATMAFLDSAVVAQAESKLRSAIQAEPSSAAAHDRLAVFLWKRGKDLDEARRLALKAVSLDGSNLGYRINLAHILLSNGDEEAAIEALRTAAALAKTPEEIASVDEQLRDATTYASAQVQDNKEGRDRTTTQGSQPPTLAPSRDEGFIPGGPPRFVTGVLTAVHCDPPTLDLTVTSRAGNVTLHSENYFQIQFTALFALAGELQPCHDLENRTAKVEYIESANGSHTPRLIAVELQK
jgi:tetratricopeptide (TPR) repeat protein